MQPKNLGWKFAFVGLLMGMSIYSIWAKELRQGIDLRGGHILTFEIFTTGKKTPGLVESVIARLRERIDPSGLYSVELRPVGHNRIEIRMPLGTEEARRAKQEYREALEALQDSNIRRSDVRRVVSLAGPARTEAIAHISAGDTGRAEALRKVARTYDARVKAQQALEALERGGRATVEAVEKAQADYDNAAADYAIAVRELFALNVNTELLGQVLRLYVSAREAKGLSRKEREERSRKFAEQLEELQRRYLTRRTEIDAVVSGYKKWAESRTGLDDPADLIRMVARAGVLEFRIAPTLPLVPGSGGRGTELSETEHQTYLNQLAEEGPLPGHSRGDAYLWYLVHGKGENLSPDTVVSKYAGKKYVLLYNQDGYTMLREVGVRSWTLSARGTRDDVGRPAVGFTLDSRGAKLMGRLTGAHQKHFMAVLLDDEVYSVPVIESTIYANGIITGKFSPDEVDELVRILNAGALEGRVNENPVSQKTVAPSIGEDNRKAGVRAALWGLVGVAVFMMFYYSFIAGTIANVALMLNLLFLLGAMSFTQAVFTLPGIAGVILTIGIAVDANVLIFERLREEQRKTQSMQMAVRNAYSSAARAILDGNITTLLTCFILGWVGTEEVRGFAITLGLGVMFSLFTSLLVTRWIFQLLLKVRLITNRIRMLAFLGVPKINWLGKRRVFWMVSIILVVVGIGSLVKQGPDILGIEFSSGTQATFKFKQGVMIPGPGGRAVVPQRQYIEAALKDEARRLAEQADTLEQAETLTKLAQTAKVETLINPDKARDLIRKFGADGSEQVSLDEWTAQKGSKDFFGEIDVNGDGKLDKAEIERMPEWTYQVSTTVADVDLLREVVEGAFGAALDVRTSVQFELQKTGPVQGLNVELRPEDQGITHISRELAGKVSPEMQVKFVDFTGGAMFVVRNVTPALTEADLAGRIQTMRLQPDFADNQFNRTAVVGLKADPEGEGFSALAVLALNPNVDYVGRPEEWKDFATKELELLTEALARKPSLEAVSEFDPAVAGQAKWRAGFAFFLSWVVIVAYLWLRFGSARWGLAAVVCLIHDVVIAVGLVALAAFIHDNVVGQFLLIRPFQIDMAMVAAFLTIIGYSVNDTIVVFDRIRENRGKLATVDLPIINRSINQTISRTLLTTTTTLIAVVIMYVWGGAGIHAFTYALLVGIVVGTYSSIAIASPLLLVFRKALAGRAAKRPSPPAAK